MQGTNKMTEEEGAGEESKNAAWRRRGSISGGRN